MMRFDPQLNFDYSLSGDPGSDVFNHAKTEIRAEDNPTYQLPAKSEMVWFPCFGDSSWHCSIIDRSISTFACLHRDTFIQSKVHSAGDHMGEPLLTPSAPQTAASRSAAPL